MPASGHPQSDARRECRCHGNIQHLTKLILDSEMPHRKSTTVSQRSRCQQEVLACRIHRRALVRACFPIPVETDQYDDRRRFEVVDVVLHRIGKPRRSIPVARAFRCPASSEGCTEQCFCRVGLRPITEHEESERLPVRAGRSTARMPEDLLKIARWHRIVGVATDCPGRCKCLEEPYLSLKRRRNKHQVNLAYVIRAQRSVGFWNPKEQVHPVPDQTGGE